MTLVVPLLVTPLTTLIVGLGGAVCGLVLGVVGARFLRRQGSSMVEDQGEPAAEQAPTDSPVWAGDARVERALRALPLGVVVTDPSGEPVYRNKFAAQFENGRHGEALVEAAIEDVVRGAVGGHTVERTVDLYGPPAQNLQLRATPTFDADHLSGAVVLIEDVSAAQQIDRVRKDFVANVSHELRTPIGAIGVLAETLGDATDAEIVERLSGRLQTEALRLGDIIDDLLALSRLESGSVVDREPMDLNQVVELAIERTVGLAEHRKITIDRGGALCRPVFVVGDQSQVIAAVSNLLDNAIKYSEEGSIVTVDVDCDDRWAHLSVADTGVGIPGADLDRIFERFYRVDAARSRATGGTGLGLSIVRHVAVNHEGSISVESVEGQGSRFVLQLPVSAADVSPARSDA